VLRGRQLRTRKPIRLSAPAVRSSIVLALYRASHFTRAEKRDKPAEHLTLELLHVAHYILFIHALLTQG
jgi:hypothetical protein